MSESRQIEQKVNPMRVPAHEGDYNRQTDSPKSDGWACTAVTAYTVCICALAAASIVWFVYAIIALSNSSASEFKETCSESNIWASLLVAAISVGLSNLDNVCGTRDEDGKKRPNIVVIVIQLGSTTFSSVEVFRGCAMDHLRDALAYKLQFWMVVITYGIWAIGVVAVCGLCVVACREDDEERRKRMARAEQISQQLTDIQLRLDEAGGKQSVVPVSNHVESV